MPLQKKHTNSLMLFIVALFANFILQAQAPAEYYKNAEGKNGYDLKTALYNIIKGHNSQSYASLWQHFKTTDKDNYYEKDGSVLDMYSENPTGADPYNFKWGSNQCGKYQKEGDCYNREHSFPKSWFGKKLPMHTDLFHLYPTDGTVNGKRGNHPFGEVGTATWTSKNGSKVGTSSINGFSGVVFEPIDEFKGDFARTYFYMATRYQNVVSSWSSPMLNNTNKQVFKDWAVQMLLKWHTQDPVSQKEIDRNNAIYKIQKNRNPFIDHPEYVNSIWGGAHIASISNIQLTPTQPKANESVSISAKITHSDGVKSAKLLWGTNNATITNEIAMNLTTNSNYKTEQNIAGQADGTTVFYKIQVVDNKNVKTLSSIYSYSIGNVPPETANDFLNEDFESIVNKTDINLQGWINKAEKGKRKWQGREYKGNKYAQFSSYKSNEENVAWLITPKIDLSKVSEPKFTFDVNVGHFTHKGLQILLLKDFDGTNIASATKTDVSSHFTIPTKPTSGYGTFANAGKLDLSSYSGKIHIAFKYLGNGKNKKTTTYQIDNVKVEGKIVENQPPKDSVPPIFATNYPRIENITKASFDFVVKINESAKVYYKLSEDGQQPTDDSLLKESFISIEKKDEEKRKTFSSLKAATDYFVYYLAVDTSNPPNKTKVAFVKVSTKKESGIHSEKETSLSIIPNPNNGNFKITLNPKENPIKASIFSIDAQLIISKDIAKGSKNITFNMHKKAGIYILKVYFKEKIKTLKMIIE